MVESQFFEISTESDTIIEGKKGTIIQIPKEAFTDKNGQVVSGKIQIELAEPEGLDEFLLSGITSQSTKQLLESKGVFFLNASQNGQALLVNQQNPIYIEKSIPQGKRGEVLIFKGEKNEEGQFIWEESQSAEKFLVPVDMSLIDYLPEGFEKAVGEGMPFRSYTEATDDLVDSLYYSLFHQGAIQQVSAVPIDLENNLMGELVDKTHDLAADTLPCGIDPASIKALRTKKFAGSLFATRAFEERLQAIFKSCDNDLLQLYIENFDRNLWEIDAMAAKKLGESHAMYESFQNFSKERLTKVKQSKQTVQLAAYYKRKLDRIKKELAHLKREAKEAKEKKDKIAAEKREEYTELLRARERYRMHKFGFELTEFGWYKGAIYIEDLEKFILEITVSQGDQFDRVHTYIVNNKINSLFSMISDNQILFNRGYNEDKYLLMWNEQMADAIVIAYKGEQIYFEKQVFQVSKDVPALLTFNPVLVSEKELRQKLKGDFWNRRENRIKVDLVYQAFFDKESKRQKRLREERQFINKLREKAFACCLEDFNGEVLFNKHCASCHSPYTNYLVAPGLHGATSRHSMDWLIQFTQNSQKMVEEGDRKAIEVYNENSKLLMPIQPLSAREIEAIFDYVDGLGLE
tara:strand:- start:6510 stop:8408 length:1899 start_codon:yes stop_codon:yes gene_type:complete